MSRHGESSASIDLNFELGLFDDNFSTNDDARMLVEMGMRNAGTRKRFANGWEVGYEPAKRIRKALRRNSDVNDAESAIVIHNQQSQRKMRNFAEYKLYIFTKSALLTLPRAFAACMNSADMAALSSFMLPLITQDCEMNVLSLGDANIPTHTFLRFYDLISQLYPDSVLCVDSVEVDENRISASISMKYTSNKIVHESISMMAAGDPLFAPVFTSRAASLNRVIRRINISEEEKADFCARTDMDCDLLVSSAGEMILTIDDMTRKVSKMEIIGRITSIEPVQNSVSREDDSLDLLV